MFDQGRTRTPGFGPADDAMCQGGHPLSYWDNNNNKNHLNRLPFPTRQGLPSGMNALGQVINYNAPEKAGVGVPSNDFVADHGRPELEKQPLLMRTRRCFRSLNAMFSSNFVVDITSLREGSGEGGMQPCRLCYHGVAPISCALVLATALKNTTYHVCF